MPITQKETNFIKWVEEILGLPKQFRNEIIAFYKGGKKKQMTLLLVESNLADEPPSTIINTIQTGEEAFKDIKGINTAVSLESLAKSPGATIKALGKSTINDIFKLNEVASDNRSEVIENLVNGEAKIRGKDVAPFSFSVNVMDKLGLPLVDTSSLIVPGVGGGTRSAIQLLGSPNSANPADKKTDRKIVEENESRAKHYQTYRDLAGSLTGIASYLESPAPRSKYYVENLLAYNRTIASELGVDLDAVLPFDKKIRGAVGGRVVIDNADWKKFRPGGPALTSTSNGKFFEELRLNITGGRRARESLNQILADPGQIERALGLIPGSFGGLNIETQTFFKDFLQEEFVAQGFYDQLIGIGGLSAFDEDIGPSLLGKLAAQRYGVGKVPDPRSSFKKGVINRERQRLALETQLKLEINSPAVRASVASVAYEKMVQQELDRLNEIRAMFGGAPAANLADPSIIAVERTAIVSNATNASNRALARLDSASKSADIARNLFFAGSTKDLLESIEEGKFVEVVLINSRILGMLPFANKKFGSPGEYLQGIDKLGIGKFRPIEQSVGYVVAGKEFIGLSTGLAFAADSTELRGIPKLMAKTGKFNPFEGEVWVNWKRTTPMPLRGGGTYNKNYWTQTRVNPLHAQGMFGSGSNGLGIYDLLNNLSLKNGQLLTDCGFANPALYSAQSLLADLTPGGRFDLFMDELKSAANDMLGGSGSRIASPFHKLADALNLGEYQYPGLPFNATTNRLSFDVFSDQLTKFNSPNGGRQLLERLGTGQYGSFALDAVDRWDFLVRIAKENKISQFLKPYVGILNRYNRFANAIYTFLYREVLWGGYTGSNILIKAGMKLTAPASWFMRGFGMGDETIIAEAIAKWRWVEGLTNLGKSLMSAGTNPTAVGGFVGRLMSGRAAAWATTALSKIITSTVLKSVGWLLTGTAGALSGGIGYLVAGFGEASWAFFKNLFTKGIDDALSASKEVLTAKIRTIIKLVGFISLGCCTCILLPIIATFAILATLLAPVGELMFGGGYVDSELIKVEKTATEDLANKKILYTITISNNTSGGTAQTVEIENILDTLTHTGPCLANGSTEVTDSSQFQIRGLGQVTVPAISDIGDRILLPGSAPKVITFELTNINTTDQGTYLNTVEVKAIGENNRIASSSVSTSINGGGCARCPKGWPTDTFTITQGPKTNGGSHDTLEAADFIGSLGQEIKATHNGTAYAIIYNTNASCFAGTAGLKDCGYGNYVDIESPLGFKTRYAHLSGFSMPTTAAPAGSSRAQVGTAIVKYGDPIGVMGNTGYFYSSSGTWSGVHLHYEFVNTNIQCVPGKDLLMINLQNTAYPESYVPETIPRGCSDSGVCNISR